MLDEKPRTTSRRAEGVPAASNDASAPLVKVSGWTPSNGAAYLQAKKIEQKQEEQEEQEDTPTRIRYYATNIPRDHQALFAGDIKNLHRDNLFRLAKHWTMTQIAEKVNAAHGAEVMNHKALSNRLSRDISIMAERDGKPRDALLQELRAAQKANGVPINGRKPSEGPTSPKKRGGSTKRKQRTNPDLIPALADRDGDIDMMQDDHSSSPARASEFGEEGREEDVAEEVDDEDIGHEPEDADSEIGSPTKPKAILLGKRRREDDSP